MKKQTHPLWTSIFLLCALGIALLSSACGASSTAQQTIAATPTPDQPVTRQQLFSSGPFTYVAMGASDAVGVGTSKPDTQGYVPQLAERLPTGSHTINLGISGAHLHEALERELPLALSAQPKLITIWLVANDFVAGVSYTSYMSDLDTLLKQLRAGTQARIVMANLPDLTRLPSFSHFTAKQKTQALTEIKRWNTTIATIAARYKVTIVDLFAQGSQITAHPEYISYDGFHPSSTGYTQLAGFFWSAIHG
jgi:acyl-CoA thioesterase-1